MEVIFLLIGSEVVELAASEALIYETKRNPFADRKAFVGELLQKATYFQPFSAEILIRAQEFESNLNIKGLDALNLACAEILNVDAFVTCDDRLTKKYTGTLSILNPTEIAMELIGALEEEK